MTNTLPCGKCRFYDIILGSYEKETKRGWCMKRSKYPYKEGPGQVFPPNVERVEEGQLAQPFIVKGNHVISVCTFAETADQNPREAKRERITVVDREGKRTLS